MQVIQHPLPYFEERRGGKKPIYLIMHYTDTRDLENTLYMFNQNRVSAHYCVDDDGKIIQIVDESMRAWHAGVAHWKGESDINSASIGIEIQNKGHTYGYKPFPAAQIAAVEELALDIMKRNGIRSSNVIGHSDIAPNRKSDPGYLFPWEKLALKGIGIWPQITANDIEKAEKILNNESRIRKIFELIGYAPIDTFGKGSPSLENIINVFQQHFEPELFINENLKNKIGIASARTIAIALKLSEEF